MSLTTLLTCTGVALLLLWLFRINPGKTSLMFIHELVKYTYSGI